MHVYISACVHILCVMYIRLLYITLHFRPGPCIKYCIDKGRSLTLYERNEGVDAPNSSGSSLNYSTSSDFISSLSDETYLPESVVLS